MGKASILVVEDDVDIQQLVSYNLIKAGFNVTCADSGEEALQILDQEQVDLILLDLMLPGMDGMEICRKLRNEEKIKSAILMLTARGQIKDRVEGLNCGADDYLTKPFAFEELLARIKALSRRPRDSLGTVLSIDDLKLDTISYEVKRAGRPVILSKTEYSLLEFLLKNKGKVLSKNQIIENVWDYDADVLPNTVEVYIRYLRNKIEKPFKGKKPLIGTIRGFGYRIGGNK